MKSSHDIATQLRRTGNRHFEAAHQSTDLKVRRDLWERADNSHEVAEMLDPCDPSDR